MNGPGGTEDLLAQSRSALLDALQALDAHRDAVIVVGAQAIYLRTAGAPVGLADATRTATLSSTPVVFTMTRS